MLIFLLEIFWFYFFFLQIYSSFKIDLVFTSLKNHWRQLDGIPVWNRHIRPRLIKLDTLWNLFTQCGLDGLFVLDSFHKLVDELVILFFHLKFEEFPIGQYAAFVHDFILFFSLNKVLGLFEVFVLTMANFVEPSHHAIVLHVILELTFLFNLTHVKSFPGTFLLFCP